MKNTVLTVGLKTPCKPKPISEIRLLADGIGKSIAVRGDKIIMETDMKAL